MVRRRDGWNGHKRQAEGYNLPELEMGHYRLEPEGTEANRLEYEASARVPKSWMRKNG